MARRRSPFPSVAYGRMDGLTTGFFKTVFTKKEKLKVCDADDLGLAEIAHFLLYQGTQYVFTVSNHKSDHLQIDGFGVRFGLICCRRLILDIP